MCFAAMGRLQGRAAKLLLVRRISLCYVETLHITARQLREFALPGAIHRLIVPVVSMELSRWAAGYGAVFAK